MLDSFVTMGKIVPSVDAAKRQCIIDNRNYLLNHSETITHVIDPKYAYQNAGNLYSYCKDVGFENGQIFPIMVLNGFGNATSFLDTVESLVVPSLSAIQYIYGCDGIS